jgi:hypothetical protein
MATTSPTPVSPKFSASAVPEPTEAQQRVLERIAAQRERLRARRAARAQAVALGRPEQGPGGIDESLALRAAGFAKEHPLAVAAMAGVALMAGPRRLIRWAGVALPLLMRLRR